MKIETWNQSSASARALVREIFFLSADPRNVSEVPAANDAFFEKWTGYYFDHRAEWIFLAWEGEKLLAYLMCEPDSQKALPYFHGKIPSYELFADLFGEFPAHLHMNAHPEARGRGIGSVLVEHMCTRLRTTAVPGVHLITSRHQRNAAFYRKNGFTSEVERDWRGHPLLFMGRRL